MIVVHDDDVITHDEVLIAAPFRVDRDERFGNLHDPHVIGHDRAHAHGEVGVVDSRHVAAAENILADLGSLFRRQVYRGLLALLGLALTLILAFLALVLRIALLSLALLGRALTLVPALLVLILRVALLSLALLRLALTLIAALLVLVLGIALLSLALLSLALTLVLTFPVTILCALLVLTLPVALRRLTGRTVPRGLVFLGLLRLSGAFRLPVVWRLS